LGSVSGTGTSISPATFMDATVQTGHAAMNFRTLTAIMLRDYKRVGVFNCQETA